MITISNNNNNNNNKIKTVKPTAEGSCGKIAQITAPKHNES